MLQQLSGEPDAGSVIVYDEVDIDDAQTWRKVQRRQYRGSEDFLVRAIKNLQRREFSPQEMDLGPIRTAPKIGQYINYLLKIILED